MKRLLFAGVVFFLPLPLLQAKEIVFASYNLENFFTSVRSSDFGMHIEAQKPEKAIAAQARIISEIHPDILGVCEMGSPEDFEEFKSRLKTLGYTDFEYVNGPDPDRHLALLSKFPIIARHTRADIPFELHGLPEKVKRGILDVTIQVAPGYEIRFVGLHLKSKLAVSEGEALLRRHEAHLVREHLQKILKDTPETKLLVYGDFNDTKNQPAIQEILGPRGSHEELKDLWLHDEQGDRWTYYWKQADTYSRIDYLLANRSLFPSILQSKSRVFRSSDWNIASDHRPIITTIDTDKD